MVYRIVYWNTSIIYKGIYFCMQIWFEHCVHIRYIWLYIKCKCGKKPYCLLFFKYPSYLYAKRYYSLKNILAMSCYLKITYIFRIYSLVEKNCFHCVIYRRCSKTSITTHPWLPWFQYFKTCSYCFNINQIRKIRIDQINCWILELK